jgi:predicted ATPase
VLNVKDGLPLAIELAAARTKLFPPAALLARLEKRLALLSGGARDLLARHQTLRSTIDWSYDLLNPDEQRLFTRLGVFVGSCTLEAVEAVCKAENDLAAQVLDLITSLVNKSLLLHEDQQDGEPRFSLLETIREYALERLAVSGAEELLRDQHAAYYLALAEQAEPELTGARQAEWLNTLEREHDNMRTALRWVIERGLGETSIRLTAALWRFWYIRGHVSEGRRWLERVLASHNSFVSLAWAKSLFGARMISSVVLRISLQMLSPAIARWLLDFFASPYPACLPCLNCPTVNARY